jgi:hypothetical protein
MEMQRNMIIPKEHSNSPITDSKQKEIYKLPEKKFIIMILRKLNDI